MTRAREIAKFVNASARLTNVPTPDLSNLNASNLTSGTIPNARISSGSVTQHVSATTQATGTWTPVPSAGALTVQSSRYIRVGRIVSLQAWGRGNGETYPNNFNTNRFYFTGAPITSMNTGNSSHCVGFGHFMDRDGMHQLWILSNSTEIRIGRNTQIRAADNNHTSSSTSSGGNNAEFNWNNANANSVLHPNDTTAHFAFHLNYYVDN